MFNFFKIFKKDKKPKKWENQDYLELQERLNAASIEFKTSDFWQTHENFQRLLSSIENNKNSLFNSYLKFMEAETKVLVLMDLLTNTSNYSNFAKQALAIRNLNNFFGRKILNAKKYDIDEIINNSNNADIQDVNIDNLDKSSLYKDFAEEVLQNKIIISLIKNEYNDNRILFSELKHGISDILETSKKEYKNENLNNREKLIHAVKIQFLPTYIHIFELLEKLELNKGLELKNNPEEFNKLRVEHFFKCANNFKLSKESFQSFLLEQGIISSNIIEFEKAIKPKEIEPEAPIVVRKIAQLPINSDIRYVQAVEWLKQHSGKPQECANGSQSVIKNGEWEIVFQKQPKKIVTEEQKHAISGVISALLARK
jgi:hypothetical protein